MISDSEVEVDPQSVGLPQTFGFDHVFKPNAPQARPSTINPQPSTLTRNFSTHNS